MRALLATAALFLSACATSAPACDRACQLDATRKIVQGGDIPATAKTTLNGAAIQPGASWLKTAATVTIHGEYADASSGQSMIVGTAVGADSRPAIYGLRLKQAAGKTTEAELIVVHDGEVSLFPPALPLKRDPLFDAIVEPAKRTPGKQMIAAAEAYFDGIEKTNGAAVPVTPSCERVENGVQTTHSPRFNDLGCNSLEVFAYIPEVRERRYPIVDEERGVVVGVVAFYIPGGDYQRMVDGKETTRHYDPRALFLFEAFKIVDGKIEKIEATMRNMPLGASMGWGGN